MFTRAIGTLVAAVLLTTCTSDNTLGPGGGAMRGQMDLTALFRAGGGKIPIPIDTIFVQITRISDDAIVFTKAIPVTASNVSNNGDSLLVDIQLDLQSNSEQFGFVAEARGGGIVYYTVSGIATAIAGRRVETPPLTPTYVGPGASADSVTILPLADTLAGGDSVLYQATVWQGLVPVAGVPVGFISSDTTKVKTPKSAGLGKAWAYAPRTLDDSVVVTALTPTGLVSGVSKLHFVPAAAQLVLVSGNNQNVPAGTRAALPLVVRVLDAAGNHFTRGYPVTFAVTSGAGAVLPLAAVSDTAGLAQTILTAGVTTGALQVSATAANLQGSPMQFSETVTAAPSITTWDAAADFSKTANPNGAWSAGWTATPGATFHLYGTLQSVGGFDAWVDPPIAQSVTPTFQKNNGAATSFGVAPGQVSLHDGCNAGEYSVLRWTAPAAGSYLVSGQFLNGDVGNTDAVILRNANLASPLFTVASTTGNPSFSQVLTLSANETIDFAVGAGGDGCQSDNTPILATISSVAPFSVAVNGGNNQSVTVNTAVATAPSVIVRDGSNAPVAGVTVIFAVATGGGSITGDTAITNGGGVATVGSWILGSIAGGNSLTATVTGLTPAAITATGLAGPATQLARISGDAQSANEGTALPQPLVVEAQDAFGNPVSGVPIIWTPSVGSVVPATSTTQANGRTQTVFTLGLGVTGQTVTASSGTLPSVTFNETAVVSNPAVTLTFAGLPNVGVGLTATINVTISNPAPAGGVTVAVSSNNTAFVTVPSPNVVIPQNQTTGTVVINGIAVGSATLTGHVAAGGFLDGTLSVTVEDRSISLPQSINVPYGQTASLPIQIGSNAPAGGVDMTVTSSAPGFVQVQTSPVHINAGTKTANVTLIGVLPGPATITVSNPAYTTGTTAAATSASLNIVQGSASLNASFGTSVTVNFESNNIAVAAPAPGIPVTLTSSNPACFTVPSPQTIPTGLVSITANLTYGGGPVTLPCTAQLLVQATNLQPDSIPVTVQPVPPITFSSLFNLGSGLQDGSTVFLGASNHGGTTITLTSSNPGVMLLSATANGAGQSSITLPILPNGTSAAFYYQGIEAKLDTFSIKATAPGFANAQSAVLSVVQGGVEIISFPSTTTTLSANSSFYAQVGLPNGQLTGLSRAQNVRGGAPAPLVATFTVDSPAVVGSLVDSLGGSPSGVTGVARVPIGLYYTNTSGPASGGMAFHPLGTGTDSVSVSIPGFLTMSANGKRGVTVSQPILTVNANSAQVGSGLYEAGTVFLSAGNHNGADITLTSSDPTIILVDTLPDGPGYPSLVKHLLNNQTSFTYYYQAIEAKTGAVTFTATEPRFASGTTSVTAIQPGVEIISFPSATTTLSPNSNFYAQIGLPNGQLTGLARAENIRGGAPGPLVATFTVDSPAVVGSLIDSLGGSPSGVTGVARIPVGLYYTNTSGPTSGGLAFKPLSTGTDSVTVSIPGFLTMTTNGKRGVTVSQPVLTVNANSAQVGSGLYEAGTVSLSAGNHNGADVTLASSDPAIILVDTLPNGPGHPSLVKHLNNNQTSFTYYYQAIEAKTGAVTFTATEPRFATGTTTVTAVTPGVELISVPGSTTTLSPDANFYAQIGILNAQGTALVRAENIRGGATAPLIATVQSSVAAVASVVDSTSGPAGGPTGTARIPLGLYYTSTSGPAFGGFALHPTLSGSTDISVSIPGFTTATTNGVRTVTVSQPGMTIGVNSSQVGSGLMEAGSGNLGASNHATDSVTIVSSNPGVLLISPNATTAGTDSVRIQVNSGSTGFAFYVQGVEGATGTVTITAKFSGFTNGSTAETVIKPGVEIISFPSTTTTLSGNANFYAQIGIPNGQNTGLVRAQSVRTGAPAPLVATFTVDSPAVVGALVDSLGGSPSGVTGVARIPAGLYYTGTNGPATGGLAFKPLLTGTTTGTVTIPGYTTMSVNGFRTVTVTQPVITVNTNSAQVGSGLQEAGTISLNAGNHNGADVTVTPSDPTIMLIDTIATGPGYPSITKHLNNGATSFTYYYQAIEGKTGVVSISATEPRFVTGTDAVTAVQPAVEIVGLPTTTAVAGPDDAFYAQVGLNSGGTGLSRTENVRGGAPGPLVVTFTSGTPTVGTIVDPSGPPGGPSKTAQIVPGLYYSPTSVSQGGVAFHPLTTGSSLITVDIPGFIRTSINGNRTIIVQ